METWCLSKKLAMLKVHAFSIVISPNAMTIP